MALGRARLLGSSRFRRLEAFFGTAENIWRASVGELRAAGVKERVAREIAATREKVSPDEEVERLELAGVQALTWHDREYPARLKEIHDPPPVLYVKGTILPEDERAVAVVGTRGPTAYGREAASSLSGALARSDITVVSGLALGIDAMAHRAALEQGGRTIAVVANGLDVVYPKEHRQLTDRVAEQGAVVSEAPLGLRPDAGSFPRRNRLISGMTLGTLVVEAGEFSGARWTVFHALEQGREVFCVPGNIFSPASYLTNLFIQQGAKLVSDADDILEELNLSGVAHQIEMRLAQDPLPELSSRAEKDTEGKLLEQLDHEPLHIDDIRRNVGLPIAEVSSMLTLLELKGSVRQVGCMHYIRAREASPIYGN